VEGIFNYVIATTFYGSIVGLVIILLKVVLKDKINPQWHYLIWMVLILKLLIPFGPESSISLFNFVPTLPQGIEQGIVNRETPVQILPPQLDTKPGENITDSRANHGYVPRDSFEERNVIPRNIFPFIWVIGAILTGLWVMYVFHSFKNKVQKSAYEVRKDLVELLESCKRKLGIKEDINIVIQDKIKAPSLYGLVKPKILLNPKVLSLKENELKYILLHELAHYKRKDVLMNYILLILQVVHWFNPFIWYCFKLIRQDMEVATDEKVLQTLEQREHKDYGRTLLTILEDFYTPNFVPKILGISDDKENIKRRIKMIKMTEFFKGKKRMTIIIGLICILTLSSALLTSARGGLIRNEKPNPDSPIYNAEELYRHKSLYIGDASNISNLLNKMPLATLKEGISLSTSIRPYGVTVNYNLSKGNFGGTELEIEELKSYLFNNSLIVFALIENIDYITFNDISGSLDEREYTFTRLQIQESNKVTLWEFSKDLETFKNFIKGIAIPKSKQSNSLEDAISKAVREKGSIYYRGEFLTEGHIILDIEETGSTVKVYAIASVAWFGFENGIFTQVAGTGSMPTVMVFSVNEDGEYILTDYIEPMDGSGYADSIRRMFPKEFHNSILITRNEFQVKLANLLEEQAKAYLDSIGRTAEVKIGYVEKKLPNINVEASNKLLSEFTKFVPLLNSFPYWLGTVERIEDGVRYIYETSQEKSSDGYDLIVFRKTSSDGKIAAERIYKIDGNNPILVEN
jgi:bla regulator protein BlaR1